MLIPTSRLTRLFTYSKDGRAQENFTTEALAIAIAADPRPIIAALCQLSPSRAERVGLGGPSRIALQIRPSTQVALPRGGRLDLVLEILSDTGRTLSAVWLEVKISAPESGSQLDAYREQLSTMPFPVWLVTLAHTPLRESIENLTWQRLYQHARHGAGHLLAWADFLAFLEDQDVANDSLGPISDLEAASIEPAFRLAQKVSAVVKAIHQALSLPELFGTQLGQRLRWKAEGELLNFVGANFRQRGELWGGGGPMRYGLTSQDGTAYWTIAVMSEGSKGAVVAARAQIEVAALPEWKKPSDSAAMLLTQTRATALGSHEDAVQWFKERLQELAATRIMNMLLGIAYEGPESVETRANHTALSGEVAT